MLYDDNVAIKAIAADRWALFETHQGATSSCDTGKAGKSWMATAQAGRSKAIGGYRCDPGVIVNSWALQWGTAALATRLLLLPGSKQ